MADLERKSAPKGKKVDPAARRKKQLAEVTQSLETLHQRLISLKEEFRKLKFHKSVVSGLYIEIDKLTKKAPAEEVTDLALKHVNDLIRQTKDLLKNDEYMKTLPEFVPAGNNPQHRDVIIVLRQIQLALDRLFTSLPPTIERAEDLITQAETVRIATVFYVQGRTNPNKADIAANIPSVSGEWLTDIPPYKFRFDLLDRIDIADHFTLHDEDEAHEESVEDNAD